MQFFSSAITILQTLVVAIGAGLGVWGVINLMEGYLHPTKQIETITKSEKPQLENWQKAQENGEYLRSAEITEEQNYNMIDGLMNNKVPKKKK